MKKLKKQIQEYLRQGLTPREISWAVVSGLSLGIFPIYGPISLVCLGLSKLTRLNAPIMLAGLYTMSLVKPILIIPFLRLGEWITRADPMTISLVELSRRFADSPLATLGEFGSSFIHAIIGWLIALPILMPILFRISHNSVIRLQALRNRKRSSESTLECAVIP